eukprot:PLAT12468.1.p1 GENE.PLAT12468.1~~PLAT12468.1.p1  ORF type:complete len:133 (+),score=23.31 PLAT12468.1:3-401(+)
MQRRVAQLRWLVTQSVVEEKRGGVLAPLARKRARAASRTPRARSAGRKRSFPSIAAAAIAEIIKEARASSGRSSGRRSKRREAGVGFGSSSRRKPMLASITSGRPYSAGSGRRGGGGAGGGGGAVSWRGGEE